jgi:HPt (histidine-containing phosphotransfer) domain-containing protein
MPGPAARPAAAAPPAAASAAPPALQMEVVQDLREIMGAEFDGLVRVYLEDAPIAVGRLQKAAVEGDVAALVAPAHSLKSTSANLGAMRLSDLAKSIEHGARRGDLGAPGPVVQALSAEFARVAAALRALLP